MIPVALLCLASWTPAPAMLPPIPCLYARVVPGDEKVLKAIDAWLKAYRSGKIAFNNIKDDVSKGGIAEKYGLIPKGVVGTITARRELELLLEQAVALDSAEAAEAVLTVAAIGLDHGTVKYKPEMDPNNARTVGETWLAKFKDPAALEYIGKVARGEAKTDKAYGAGIRAAAIRLLGTRHDETARALCEQQLRAAELPLRLAAAEALAALGDERSGEALATALEIEKSDVVIGSIVDALRVCFGPYLLKPSAPAADASSKAGDKPGDKPKDGAPAKPDGKPDGKTDGKTADQPADKPADKSADKPADKADAPAPAPSKEPSEAAMRGVRAAISAIGRTNWRGDMQLLRFLDEFRTMEAVPALIAVLQRFKDHPEQVQSGVLSGLLLHRAHEMLVSMTGAIYPADAPDKWAAFWQQEQQKLLVDKRPAVARAKAPQTASFMGLAVEGTRVLFIIDLSASMEFQMRKPGETAADPKAGGTTTRLEFAKTQLHRAIDELPESTRMNFVTFNGADKAVRWDADVVEANKKNKEKANKFVEDLKAHYPEKDKHLGGTNLWSGLEEGLKSRTLVYGDRDDQTLDEIFVVSDGAPSVGEVIDPLEILRLVTETNRFTRVRINTIFITSPNDKDPRNLSLAPNEFMRRLAEQNGGRFVEFNY